MLMEFCSWLSSTPLSVAIQDALWVIPAVQSVHILSVAVVLTCMAMLDLRLLGIAGRRQSAADMAVRFMPWVWTALAVLAVSGLILIIGEPARELPNTAFQAKMIMLAVVVVLTLQLVRGFRKDAAFWDGRAGVAKAIAAVSLVLWVLIVTAGRWIAYVE